MSNTVEYFTWYGMKSRCENPKATGYKNYGARGIRVCVRWRSFLNFIEDMGERPSRFHSLDRIDNDKNYSPKNCRWATMKQQAYNRRQPNRAFKNKTGYRGVLKTRSGKFAAWALGGYLGCFITAEEAAKKYNEFAKKTFGKGAVLNDV